MAQVDDFADEFAMLLFGAPILLAEPLACELAHQLSGSGYELSQWRLSIGTPQWLSWKVHLISALSADATEAGKYWHEHKRILLSPDGCWPHVVNSQAAQACLTQGIALAWFDRLDFAGDPPTAARQGAFYERIPTAMSGCLSIWAWGLSLTAQALRELIPSAKIGVIGHSRGGKAALLCGALDPRIDAVIANNSGAGGAASMATLGDGAESLQQLVQAYPHWFNQQAGQAKVQNRILDIDCCALWSRIAPRPLLVLQAEGDAWGNPRGTRETLRAVAKCWESSAASDALALIERQGGHAMQDSDWHQAAKFMRHAKFRESQH